MINRPHTFKKKILPIIIFLILSIVVVEIWAVNRLATYGTQISKLENAKQSLVLENQVLENQISQKSSLKLMDEKTQTLGFKRVKNIEVIKNIDLALNHNLPL